MEESKNGIAALYPQTQAQWRGWLTENHLKEKNIWLILYKKDEPLFNLSHHQAVEEALCFGWIDSLTLKRDSGSRYQLFTRRKQKGNWSAVNKEKALLLIKQGLMHPSGLLCIQTAMDNGMWDALNDVENLVVPEDLELELQANPAAFINWQSFPKSTMKAILKWIHEAKRPQTRIERIASTVQAAEENKRIK